MRIGAHLRSQQAEPSKYTYKADKIFTVRSSVMLILAWYPVKPCAEIILESDLFVKVLERLLVSLELLRKIIIITKNQLKKVQFHSYEIIKPYVKVEFRNAINSEFNKCYCCVEFGVGYEFCVNNKPYDGAS